MSIRPTLAEIEAKSAKNRAARHQPMPEHQKTAKRKRGKASKALAPVPTEHQEQTAVIQWWAQYAAKHKIPEFLLFAIPNGANKSMASAAKFKREGLRKGIPDLFLAMPKPPLCGLFLEMKREKNSVTSEEQFTALNGLSCQSYDVAVCRGADEAIAQIKRYLS